MNPVAFVLAYTKWHYGGGLLSIVQVWGNFLWFPLHFFSTGTLFKTLFSAWKRMHEEYPPKGHFDPGYFAGTMLVNALMRIVGFLIRAIFITISLVLFAFVFISGILFIASWLVAPIMLTSAITVGLDLIL